MSVSDLMPKYAEAVMHTPAMITSTHSAAVLPPSSSFAVSYTHLSEQENKQDDPKAKACRQQSTIYAIAAAISLIVNIIIGALSK